MWDACLAFSNRDGNVGPCAGVLPQTRSTTARAGVSSLAMGKNIYQKKQIIKGVKSDLENAQLIFSTDMSTLNIKQIDALRAGDSSLVVCHFVHERTYIRATARHRRVGKPVEIVRGCQRVACAAGSHCGKQASSGQAGWSRACWTCF